MIGHMLYAGIDVGRKGGFGLISGDKSLIRVWPMPKEHNRGVSLWGIKEVFDTWEDLRVQQDAVLKIAIEWNTSRPGEVPDYAFRFGLQTGQIDGLMFNRDGWDVEYVTPNKWKPKLGLPGKSWDEKSEQGVRFWDHTYPGQEGLIRGPRGGVHDGLLDALLMAHYSWLVNGTMSGRWSKNPPRFFGGKLPLVGPPPVHVPKKNLTK